jgi:hypothetical protein
MPALAELFRLFLSGKHLNRLAEPALWTELEKQQDSYTALFGALGFNLRLDARGFAWFQSAEANSNIGKTSRQLALLFMVIFDAQSNAGKALQRFTDWLIDSGWLSEVYKQQQELLDAEGLDPDALQDLLVRACSLGFAVAEPNGWRLLPAVCRYLDHFEGLALANKDDTDDASLVTNDDTGLEVTNDEEKD